MSNSLVNKTAARRLGQLALLIAATIAAVHIFQLTDQPSVPDNATPAARSLALNPSTAQNTVTVADLNEVYSHCPMAAVVDLHTVVTNPAQVDKLLPPYRATANRVPSPEIDADIPRIQYPVPVRAPVANPATANNLRIAQLPPMGSANQLATSDTSPTNPAPGANAADDWLINPSEWFTTEEQRQRENPQPATTTTAPAAQPQRKAKPNSGPSPTGGDWKLLTPEDLEAAESQTSATPDAPRVDSQPAPSTPEPAPPQPADSTETTLAPADESPQPTTEALPSADKPVATQKNEPTSELVLRTKLGFAAADR